MMNVFVQTSHTGLATALVELGYHVEYYLDNMAYNDLELRLKHGDIVFWQQVSGHVFYASNAHVVILSSEPSGQEEYAAATAGASAYLELDKPDKKILKHVIDSVSKGQIWMTRETIAKVFDEYAKSMEPKTFGS